MSASNKKKLRKEQEAAKLTEKQLTAQKEAKKTNLYTTLFVTLMAVILVVAIVIGINQTIVSSGVRENKVTALTVGDHKLSNAQLNYFFVDSVSNFMSQYGSYASMFGLDTAKPLDQQYLDEEAGLTWADDFLNSAKENARAVYAVCDQAEAEGFTLSEEDQFSVTSTVSNINAYAMLYGFSDGESYLKAMYGNGARMDDFEKYVEMTTIYNAYQQHYSDNLTYDAAALEAADSEDYDAYSYNTYYIGTSQFLEDSANATDEEKAASVTKAEDIAKSLVGEGSTTAEDFDAAIAALDINKDTDAASSSHAGTLVPSISSVYASWVTDAARKEGDMSYFASTTTNVDEDDNEYTTTNGYTVVCYMGKDDNNIQLKNVRHILIPFEGGTTDETTGETTYTAEEKAAAKTEAEAVLAEFQAGDATEEAFATMVPDYSTDTGSLENGGLYENVYPGQMVESFENWCYDESRKPGDTGIVESAYGYHIMYFVGNSDLTYRNYLIENDLRNADVDSWYTSLVDSVTITEGNTKYINKSLVISIS